MADAAIEKNVSVHNINGKIESMPASANSLFKMALCSRRAGAVASSARACFKFAETCEFCNSDAAPEEVSSTEAAKESPVKKSPAKKVAEPESNGKEENGSGDAPEETPAENGDEDSNDAVENGDAVEEKKEAGVKRKSVATDNGESEKTTPEKKSKVVEEAPPAEEEAA
ncbi:hypothetical protein KGM_213836 [Danaus plexippus plexippus]|uniref:Uncharacterized protein n=1 Tax=Danaus plexippus plexippus TaxID=278856 RepID=A0A212FLD4_DANPL|nr:hypothetical protein KGM_213836 [Danaus plexippus plexippus]